MKISKNKVAGIFYDLTDADERPIDSNFGGEPLLYIHGSGNLIPGMESALEGKKKGDKFSVVIPPAQAYGERNDQLKQEANRNAFPEGQELEIGMQFQVNSPDGKLVFSIIDIEGDKITLDGNHPLAGTELTFKVEVTEVRDATQSELEHGHVHGPGGHHHH